MARLAGSGASLVLHASSEKTTYGQPPRDPHLLASSAPTAPGKTALVEALLRVADAKRASPEGSTSRLDAEPEEKKRNFTLSLHPESFEEGGRAFHVLDCPGFAAFLTEVEWALQVTDGAFLAVSAADGAHNRAERTYDVLADSGRPAHRRHHAGSTTSRPTSRRRSPTSRRRSR